MCSPSDKLSFSQAITVSHVHLIILISVLSICGDWFLYCSVLKDVPIGPMENYGSRQRDNLRLAVFPNLNYSGLYEAVMNIIDVVAMVQHGQHGGYLGGE